MTDRELIEKIRDRPGMFGLDGSYYPTAMFLTGLDLGTSGRVLDGFREWLLIRKGEESSYMWIPLVLEDAFPGTGIRHWKTLTESQQQLAVDHLFALLVAFLTEREAD
ncbi:hypothetical protein OG352_19185 [Streptomyces sp. NBC_01485]|uniref:hypothetical protein n=1 Tax=Streptomyces sp. NBC_01485 TaxID=2903884 RepID=UPI002E2FAAF7|nr:hypothetical protein [Streptomyces sp. NBC_01485]